jgi:hypothetical protein
MRFSMRWLCCNRDPERQLGGFHSITSSAVASSVGQPFDQVERSIKKAPACSGAFVSMFWPSNQFATTGKLK